MRPAGLTALAAILLYAVIVFASLLISVSRAPGHDHHHMHGDKRAAVDWYDPACCSQRDCAPIPDPENVEALPDGAYRYGKHVFTRGDVKPSQDSRVHVCVLPSGVPMCIYIRMGF